MQSILFSSPLYAEPADDCGLETELLHGEQIEVLSEQNGWARVRSLTDGYTGYIQAGSYGKTAAATHVVTTLGSFLFSGPNLKSPAGQRLSFLSHIAVQAEDGDYAQTARGWLHRTTLQPLGAINDQPLAIARQFLGIPYKWGGRTTMGMDCSALVQLAFAACGMALPRNCREQQAFLPGKSEPIAAGDVVFVPGHVGIASGPETMIHASGHSMRVVEESIEKMARDREVGLADVIVKSGYFHST